MNLHSIRIKHGDYWIDAEYCYKDDGSVLLTGLQFENPTQTLMFLYENALGVIDSIDKQVCTLVVQRERDEQEYKVARDRLEQWYPERRPLKG